MGNNRKSWEKWSKGKVDFFSMNPFAESKSNRQSRVRRALDKKVILPCSVTTQEVNGDQLHQGSTGGLVITGEGFIAVKLPYGISANDIWRATIDEETGKQRNSLSLSAKKFKRRVFEIYAPIFKAMEWKAISKHCEIRLMVQPPRKVRSYSASTYPRFDIDNYPKLLIDSLKGSELLYKDDNIFVKEKIEFAEPIENGCVWLSCVFISETNWLDKKIDFDWLAGRVA
ncbi:RusA family crossover junction endodeoxyribonuclease [Acinetobacter sp. VNK23]|uniref:RusA family crossover junction endodeoxyribonuclease n=1 Tax=Acinetobacter TaxID=469 RepID=UPI002447D1B1|nr:MULTISPECIES: RusA family crossover junction endodeoxyribonuclease [Acinetobacter]MDH0718222.1 RusA family crossover junction endodeoxyribonuclease [Acinetobacter junii]MDM1021631.1 RusA family crossover junction endodeoxyribonuclease [Acinetobacter thutiue]